MSKYLKNVVLISVFIIIAYLFYIYKYLSYTNVETTILKQVREDNQSAYLNTRYSFNDLMGYGYFSYDYLIFANGVLTETREKIFAIKKDRLVKVFYWRLDSDGEVSKNQIIIDSNLDRVYYRCNKNSSFEVAKVDIDSKLYYLRLIDCDILHNIDAFNLKYN